MASASDFRTGLLLCCLFFSKNQGSLLPGKNFNNASSRPTPTSNSIKAYTTPRSRLRETLGDDAETPRYIETVPRKGYRFIAPVKTANLSLDGDAFDGHHFEWLGPMVVRVAVAIALAAGAASIATWQILRKDKDKVANQLPLDVTQEPDGVSSGLRAITSPASVEPTQGGLRAFNLVGQHSLVPLYSSFCGNNLRNIKRFWVL